MSLEYDISKERSRLSASKRALLEKRLRGKTPKTPKVQQIPRRTKTTPVLLSFAQQRLWFLEQFECENSAYNIPFGFHMTGAINAAVLERSINEIVRRHEALRTSFLTEDGKPVKTITPTFTVPLIIKDLRKLSKDNREAKVRELALKDARHPFDLAQCPLFRILLLQLDEEDYVLLITIHHIIYDGWSIGVFARELTTLYEAFLAGRPSPLPELPIQYADFAQWQREWLHGGVLEQQLSYWKKQLADIPPVLELPTDYPRPARQNFRGDIYPFVIPEAICNRLKTLSQQEKGTLFMTSLTAFNTLLYRHTGQEDIVVGSPVANRHRAELEGLIGFFANTLVLRTDLSGNPTFRELLRRVRTMTLEAQAHQDMPFDLLVEELHPERNLSHQPLFQVVFALQNISMQMPEFPGIKVEPVNIHTGTAKFDLFLEMIDSEQGLTATFEYNTDLFDAETITRMAEHFLILLEGIMADPDQRISELPLLTERERKRILVEWNDTHIDYPKDSCLYELFEAQVERTPDTTAVVFEDQQLTYRELNNKANQLAHYLQTIGVGPEALVAICMERSLEMIVAIWGILKAGGAYVPLNPAYPQERLGYMLEETRVLLTQKTLMARFSKYQGCIICLDTDWEQVIVTECKSHIESHVTAKNLAYVIYTSGSTGKPKGVMIEHRSVVNLVIGLQHAIYHDCQDSQLRVSLNGPLAFDTSVKQIFQLLQGHILDIIPESLRFDGKALLSYLRCHNIDVFDCTPSQLKLLLSAGMLMGTALFPKCVLVGGEPIDESTWARLAQTGNIIFYNVYGPTECTVDATVCNLRTVLDKPVIGCPIANTETYILAPELQPVPIGVSGELYIGGAGLARGYLNAPEETAETFLPNPFNSEPGNRVYKTGDRARYLPDGNIEFYGRTDNQVKIRGFRIELDEIKTIIEQYPDVQEAVVIVREEVAGDKRLVAYIVPMPERSPTIAGRQRYTLPNNLAIVHLNQNETDFLYKEIFEVQAYLRHGIAIHDGDCIFDVGSNIGLFTLFAHLTAKDSKIYSFEPNPFVFEILRLNTSLYRVNAELFNCGLSDTTQTTNFTFYPGFSILSGLYADEREEKEVVRSFILKQHQDRGAETSYLNHGSDELLEELLAEKFKSQMFTVQLRTLTDVIEEHNVERIDLLKINVEKSELDVLAGIGEEHWKKIRQIAMEVHAIDGRLSQVKSLLRKHGYQIEIEKDWSLEKTVETNYYVYALCESRRRKSTPIFAQASPSTSQMLSDPFLSTSELGSFLKQKLPDYMVPSSFMLLEALPLNPNGKVDRRALPEPDIDRPELSETFVAPRTPAEKTMTDIWSGLLHIDRIGVHDNFFELGGHSLLAVQLISEIEHLFQVKLPLWKLFESPTIAELVRTMQEEHWQGPEKVALETQIIDGSAEATLDEAIRPGGTITPLRSVTDYEHIFLTGVTGFLGAFLLYELLQQSRANIYCLVRSSDVEEGRRRIRDNLERYFLWHEQLASRIVPVPGDLSQPLLGLSPGEFDEMARRIELIYHGGAVVNLIYPYSTLKPANVLGTQEILHLASLHTVKPVHYVSTVAVFPLVQQNSDAEPISEDTTLDAFDKLHIGYSQSKWVAEKLITTAHSRGIPCSIYRPSRIAGHSQTGLWNTSDFACRMLKGCIQMGIAPQQDTTENWVPVDYVSRAIVHLSQQETSQGQVFHLINPKPIDWNDLVDWICAFGYPLRKLPYSRWRKEFTERAPENALTPLTELFQDPEKFAEPQRFSCQNTLAGLEDTSITCPPVDTVLLHTYFAYFLRSHFLEPPQVRS